ncbi:hypothetical protein DPMN_047274 [Dreissena polymorpha]|uniref:Peptidase S1 domain-containing protein n=1 Tax=Dreissena polymorpha TaxID=45954 RepID=A0A9D4DB54_DREPO|nr:hypothetical protein DPMN_047274 [Dreissena polymorpha]
MHALFAVPRPPRTHLWTRTCYSDRTRAWKTAVLIGQGGYVLCTAAVIHPERELTAAHCLHK